MLEGSTRSETDIAVVGFAVKFPQEASTVEGFWDLLMRGASARSEVPGNRHKVRKDLCNVFGVSDPKHGHFVAEPLGAFDAPFFSILPHEAECMDPQQQWLLETSYHALENAGMSIEQVSGSNTSVFTASFNIDHETVIRRDLGPRSTYHATGSAASLLSNRISWFYNFTGPSLTVNTACSGSLVALHMACESLRSGETTMGFVCGSNLILTPESTASLSSLGVLSPDGICHSFDARANGYSRGEGIACLIIKPLQEAMRDGDPVRAIIRGTGVNNNGRTSAITRPNFDSLVDLMHRTHQRFGINPKLVHYVEAHGTGTKLGDTVEAEAIATVFSSKTTGDDSPVYIGAVKSNVGHLEATAGLAGLIKTILVLERGTIPPNLWFSKTTGTLKNARKLVFPTRPTSWPFEGLRRASVNSFGFGGTNAYVVVDDAKSRVQGPVNQPKLDGLSHEAGMPKVLLLSAAGYDELIQMQSAYSAWFADERCNGKEEFVDSLAYTLTSRRSHLLWRSFSICESSQDLQKLNFSAPSKKDSNVQVCFIFTGEGSQWITMGKGLLSYHLFRHSIEQADDILRLIGCQFSVLEMLCSNADSNMECFNAPEFFQPLCTAFQIALVELLSQWNITPCAVVGHSSGEIAAAFCAGLITKPHALTLAFFRGLAIAAATRAGPPSGAMMAVESSSDTCQKFLSEHNDLSSICITSYDSPRSTTLSGSAADLERLGAVLNTQGMVYKLLSVTSAYHNREALQTAADCYLSMLEEWKLAQKDVEIADALPVPMFSTVSGTRIERSSMGDESFQSKYWVDNLILPVRFAEALGNLAALRNIVDYPLHTHLIEIGPNSALQSIVAEAFPKLWSKQNLYSSVLNHEGSTLHTLMKVAGRLHCQGYPVDLGVVNKSPQSLKAVKAEVVTDLPLYPFSRSRLYGLKQRIDENNRLGRPLYCSALELPAPEKRLELEWRDKLGLCENPFLEDHKISGYYLYPAAGILLMTIKACRQIQEPEARFTAFRFRDVAISKCIVVPESPQSIEIKVRIRRLKQAHASQHKSWEFQLYSGGNESWLECGHGYIGVEMELDETHSKAALATEHARRLRICHSECKVADFYANLASSELFYGSGFRSLERIRHDENSCGAAHVNIRQQLIEPNHGESADHHLQLIRLDNIFQASYIAMSQGNQRNIPTLVPNYIENLWLSVNFLSNHNLRSSSRVSVHGIANDERSHTVNLISTFRDDDTPVLEGNLTFTSIPALGLVQEVKQNEVCLYHLAWKPDVNLLSPQDALAPTLRCNPIDSEMLREKEYLCYHAIKGALESLDITAVDDLTMPGHLRKYVMWMRAHIDHLERTRGWDVSKKHRSRDMDEMYCRAESFGPEGKLIVRLSQALVQILQVKIDPLQILFDDAVLAEYYQEENPPKEVVNGVKEYINYLSHANPSLQILEIGAGTGSVTKDILKALHSSEPHSGDTPTLTSQYTFTDISPAFFKQAIQQFGTANLLYRILDIEKNPATQGFGGQTYDVIIASNVLHATQSLESTLRHTRSLLRPGGKLILIEGLNPGLTTLNFIFGCLPGWWRSMEDYRSSGPLIPLEKWAQLLRDCQFTGADLIINGTRDSESLASAIITTSVGSVDHLKQVNLVTKGGSSRQKALSDSLKMILERDLTAAATITTIVDMDAQQFGPDCTHVLLFTPDGYNLEEPSSTDLTALRNSVTFLKNVVWVWQKAGQISTVHTQEGIPGLCRAVLSENENINIVTLGLEHPLDTERSVRLIKNTLLAYFSTASETGMSSANEELLEFGGRICLGRLVRSKGLEKEVRRLEKSSKHHIASGKDLSSPPLFHADGTYVISGGLGGLGKSIATWMVTRGAKNLILLSRRGREHSDVGPFILDLQALGVTVFAPACDISKDEVVSEVFRDAKCQMPPIRGWIQGAMVLKSAMFKDMTSAQWTATVGPKVAGTMNIQRHIPTTVDFTIFLSSVCGIIGASGQSNYAFACAYQDALAKQKMAMGENTISLDLAILEDVGYTAKNPSIASFMQSQGLQTLSPQYLHAMLEYYCSKDRSKMSEEDAQVVVGIMSVEESRRRTVGAPRYLSRPLFKHLCSVHEVALLNSKNPPTHSLPRTKEQYPLSSTDICKAICSQLSETLAIESKEIDSSRPLHVYGVDSLVAIDLRRWLKQVLNEDVAILDILSNTSIDSLAKRISERHSNQV